MVRSRNNNGRNVKSKHTYYNEYEARLDGGIPAQPGQPLPARDEHYGPENNYFDNFLMAAGTEEQQEPPSKFGPNFDEIRAAQNEHAPQKDLIEIRQQI